MSYYSSNYYAADLNYYALDLVALEASRSLQVDLAAA